MAWMLDGKGCNDTSNRPPPGLAPAKGAMMAYRHAQHAGNHGDVVKHAVLAALLARLSAAGAPVTYLETHAGEGLYRLPEGTPRRRCLARLLATQAPAAAHPYLAALCGLNSHGTAIRRYPGSPCIAILLLNPQDHLVLCERDPAIALRLARRLRHAPHARIATGDGYRLLETHRARLQTRTVVLMDPPYTAPGEWGRALSVFEATWRRWPRATAALWYPLRAGLPLEQDLDPLPAGLLRVELTTRAPDGGGMFGSGLLIASPPPGLREDLETLMPWLATHLATPSEGRWTLR
jgi:23S rRNA (adenine2030-N6)-methyltransferase